MALSDAELFKKLVVSRPPAASILSSLLSSPKTTCSSPDLASPSDVFSDCDITSRTYSPSPPARTPPRKSCISFAAAQPKLSSQRLSDSTAKTLETPNCGPSRDSSNGRNQSGVAAEILAKH